MADVHIAEKIIEKYRLKRSREFFGNDLLLPERIRNEDELAGMDTDQKHKSIEKDKEKAKKKEEAEAKQQEEQRAAEAALKSATLKRAIQMFSNEAIAVLEKHAKPVLSGDTRLGAS